MLQSSSALQRRQVCLEATCQTARREAWCKEPTAAASCTSQHCTRSFRFHRSLLPSRMHLKSHFSRYVMSRINTQNDQLTLGSSTHRTTRLSTKKYSPALSKPAPKPSSGPLTIPPADHSSAASATSGQCHRSRRHSPGTSI